ncbi:hypothetical protein FACS189465_1880 [Clostridia bacterium]|nr:hypothetical protein FACS189465_1880 [Clostridia bacterium]
MRKQVSNNSSNSSIPPSRDFKPNNKSKSDKTAETTKSESANEFNGRIKTSRKSGGQVGHDGHTLNKTKVQALLASENVVHQIIEHNKGPRVNKLSNCYCQETNFSNCVTSKRTSYKCVDPKTNDFQKEYVSKYVIDGAFQGIIREHRFYKDENGEIVIPEKYRAHVQYGSELKCFVAMLSGHGMVSSSRIRSLISEASKNVINLSDGTVYNFLSKFSNKSKKLIKDIENNLLNNEILQVDETGMRCESKNMCIRNYSNNESVLYTANSTKSKAAIIANNILPLYVGIVIHDHNTVNYNYGTDHGECNVHGLRYLRANTEHTSNAWSQEMIEFLVNLNNKRKEKIQLGEKYFSDIELSEYSERYNKILEKGFLSNEKTKSPVYKADEGRLLRRLKKYKNHHLLFAYNFDVPFDNNMSERDLRVAKVKQKVSGCFRSLLGAKRFANLLTIIKTAIRKKSSPYKTILNIFKKLNPTFA